MLFIYFQRPQVEFCPEIMFFTASETKGRVIAGNRGEKGDRSPLNECVFPCVLQTQKLSAPGSERALFSLVSYSPQLRKSPPSLTTPSWIPLNPSAKQKLVLGSDPRCRAAEMSLERGLH